jgi:hypothetical protein
LTRLKAIDPDIRQVNIGLTEINITPSGIEDYTQKLDLERFAQVPPADYLLFSQQISYEDLRKEFKKSLEKMKKSVKASLLVWDPYIIVKWFLQHPR